MDQPATDLLEVEVTCPDDASALTIAQACIEERLAACAGVGGSVRSLYRWDGGIRDDTETLLRLKTTRDRFDALSRRVMALHPYEVPAILAIPIAAANAAYANWLRAETEAT